MNLIHSILTGNLLVCPASVATLLYAFSHYRFRRKSNYDKILTTHTTNWTAFWGRIVRTLRYYEYFFTERLVLSSPQIYCLRFDVPTYNAIHHHDVIKWKHFPRYWPFGWGIHRSMVNSQLEGPWRGALMFSFICIWINSWVKNREAGDLRRLRTHYYVIVMITRLKSFMVFQMYNLSWHNLNNLMYGIPLYIISLN